ncbi:MAG: hypothetical protein ACRC1W_13295 [Shewanella sp.]
MRQYDALLEYHLGIDPNTLTDKQWAIKVQNLIFARDQEKTKGVDELLKKMLGK